MNPAVIRAYEEIALERPHVCTGCHGRTYLSHSHLIPRSYSRKYEAVKENIVYHCMSQANDCHAKWEGMEAPLLKDFFPNMKYIFHTDPTYFWKKLFKLQNLWEKATHRNQKAVCAFLSHIKLWAEHQAPMWLNGTVKDFWD